MAKFSQKQVAVIINPIAGTNLPIISMLNTAFSSQGIEWRVHVTNKGTDIPLLTRQVLRSKPDVLYVLGGDGTQCAVLEGMGQNQTPVAILPAGTANIMAKEFGIPLDLQQAMDGFVRSEGKIRPVTRCKANGSPFFLRLSVGVLADMVAQATRQKKNQLGVLAYPLSALQSYNNSTPQIFRFGVDGKLVQAEGISLVINNFGNVGVAGRSFLPIIDPSDEFLDVIVVQATDLASLMALAKATLADDTPSTVMQHWRGKKIRLELPDNTLVIHDDEKRRLSTFTAQTTSHQVCCLLPRM